MMILRALEWTYEADLNAPPGRWACTFLDQEGFRPTEAQPQAGTTRVAIDVVVQGQRARLVDGVVRQWGVRETPDGVVSTAEGLDLKADLLDFRPTQPITFRGLRVLAPGEPTPFSGRVVELTKNCAGQPVRAEWFETFHSAAARVAQVMGRTAAFECHDYVLGTDVVWEPSRTANDILAELAAPFNATERFKLDVFVDASGTLRFVERERTPPPVVEVDYMQLLERQVAEAVPPPAADVRVEGATVTFTEPDCGRDVEGAVSVNPDTGQPEPYTITERRLEYESFDVLTPLAPSNAFVGSFDVLVAERVRTKYFDAAGLQTREVQTIRWHNYVLRHPKTGVGIEIRPKPRLETIETVWEYAGTRPRRMIRTTFVQDGTVYIQIAPDGSRTALTANVSQITEREEQETTYDNVGDPVTITSTTYAAAEPKPTAAGNAPRTPLLLVRKVEESFSWSGGMRIRSVMTREFDTRLPGRQISSRTFTEIAPGRGRPMESVFFSDASTGPVGVWGRGGATGQVTVTAWPPATSGAVRTATFTLEAGPQNAALRFVFPILGRPQDCAYFRARILAERGATRYGVTLQMLPDLNVREGVLLRVLHAPTRWRTAEFFVHARAAQQSARGTTMTIRGVAWL